MHVHSRRALSALLAPGVDRDHFVCMSASHCLANTIPCELSPGSVPSLELCRVCYRELLA